MTLCYTVSNFLVHFNQLLLHTTLNMVAMSVLYMNFLWLKFCAAVRHTIVVYYCRIRQ